MVTDSRILAEGYGDGAWHGADLKAALAGVTPDLAFWRPAAGRHNIAEIALHHAFCARAVRAQLSGVPAEPFVVPGEDWFALAADGPLSWAELQGAVATEDERLKQTMGRIEQGSLPAALNEVERANLALGITCHAVYHAGQIQLIKRLREA